LKNNDLAARLGHRLMLGIIGEYIGRIYDEAKGKPLYIIDEKVGF
jgi:dolichol-phosphate mannosyltransferase